MIATWMLYGAVIAILAGIGALALERGARLLGRAGRWCWVGAMVVTLALPVVAWLRPITSTRAPTVVPSQAPVAMAPAVAPAAPVIPPVVTTPRSWDDFDRPLAWGWGLLSLGLVSWFALGWMRLGRMRRSWRSEDGVLVSKDVGPAVIGFLRCQVVVPEWSLELTQVQRELLLAHEAEHLEAHDARLLMLAAVVLALVPWNVALWWQFRRLRLAIELDCDSRVLRRRPDPATYGRLLLDVGARAARTFIPVAAFHEPMSSLEARIRSITSTRPRGAGVLAVALIVIAGGAFFGACEAPRPTGPQSKKESYSIQINQEDGRIQSTYIGDSVRSYFGSTPVQSPSFLWFVVSPDHHVLRHGMTPRRPLGTAGELEVAGHPAYRALRMLPADSVIPHFEYSKTQSLTIVGEDAMGPGSQPVYWAVLRDPSKPATWLPPSQSDSFLSQRWVHEALAKNYGELLEMPQAGTGLKLWVLADSSGRVFQHIVEEHSDHQGVGAGDFDRLFPGLPGDAIVGVRSGDVVGFPRKGVQLVWATLGNSPAVKQWMEREVNRSEVEEREAESRERREGERREGARGASEEENAVRLREAVAKYYPQYLNDRADPPVVLWFLEGPEGGIVKHLQTPRGHQEGVGDVPAELVGPGHFDGWIAVSGLSEDRSDVTLVWVHRGHPK